MSSCEKPETFQFYRRKYINPVISQDEDFCSEKVK